MTPPFAICSIFTIIHAIIRHTIYISNRTPFTKHQQTGNCKSFFLCTSINPISTKFLKELLIVKTKPHMVWISDGHSLPILINCININVIHTEILK